MIIMKAEETLYPGKISCKKLALQHETNMRSKILLRKWKIGKNPLGQTQQSFQYFGTRKSES